MRESSYKIPDGKLVKVKLQVSVGQIENIKILGDFFLHPEEAIQNIEEALIGAPEDENIIETRISNTLAEMEASFIGATARDIAKTIMIAWEANDL
ncbi:MAG: lipoate protein ligase C-terminal domain-containing protein [Candidatus Thorarchaeota archaeon SMTZ1-45]